MATVDEIVLNKFDIGGIDIVGKKFLFVGPPKCGATTLVKDFLHHNQHTFSTGVVISSDMQSYGEYMSGISIYDTYTCGVVNNLIDFQQQHDVNVFYVDESNCKIEKNTTTQKLFLNPKMTVIVTSNQVLSINSNLRANINYVCLFYTSKVTEQQKMFDHYGGIFSTFKEFKKVYTKYAQNYGCIIIDNLSITKKITDGVFYYCPQSCQAHKPLKFNLKNIATIDIPVTQYEVPSIDNTLHVLNECLAYLKTLERKITNLKKILIEAH